MSNDFIDLWKTFVYKNHHKSRDLEIVILERSDFYSDEVWYIAIMPNPYLCEGPVVSDSYKSKDLAIISLIHYLFHYMEDWCNEVLNNPDDYDDCQKDQANYFKDIESARTNIKNLLKKYEKRGFLETEIKDILNLD